MGIITIFLGIVFIFEGQLHEVGGAICTDYSDCPGTFDTSQETDCCDSSFGSKYCCDASSYLGDTYTYRTTYYFNYAGVIGGIIFTLFVISVVVAIVVCVVIRLRKRGGITHTTTGFTNATVVNQQMPPGTNAIAVNQHQSHGMIQHQPYGMAPPPYPQPVYQEPPQNYQPPQTQPLPPAAELGYTGYHAPKSAPPSERADASCED